MKTTIVPDHAFTARTLLAMRHEVQTQGDANLRVCAMFNALAGEYAVEPVVLTIPNTDPVDPVVRRGYEMGLRLQDMGLRLDRTAGDDRRYRIVCPSRATAPDDCILTLEEVEALVPELRQVMGKLWSPAAVELLKSFVDGKDWADNQ